MIVQHLYPQKDITINLWEGVSNNTNKYANIDEGYLNPDSNYIRRGQNNTTVFSGVFGLGKLLVDPDYLTIYVSGTADTNLTSYIKKVELLDNLNNVIHKYTGTSNDYFSSTFNKGGFNFQSVKSGIDYNNNEVYCNILFSGLQSGSPTTLYTRLDYLELIASGETGIINSGIPLYIEAPPVPTSSFTLYISGPKPVVECLTVINASGYYADSNILPSSWRDQDGTFGILEDKQETWWSAVSNGVHNPEDSTYVYPYKSGVDVGCISPYFYMKPITLNNVTSGNVCFRLANNGNQFNPDPFIDGYHISNITWTTENQGVVTFPDLHITPSSTFTNFCTSPTLITFPNPQSINNNWLQFNVAINNYPTHSISDIHISEIEICVTGLDPIQSSYIPLYTQGSYYAQSGLDLYLYGNDIKSSGLDLYTIGYQPINSGITLYTTGKDTINSGTPLYVEGFLPISSGFTLYTAGPFPKSGGFNLYTAGPFPYQDGMPLFLKTNPIPILSQGLSLYTFASTSGADGIQTGIPLFVRGTGTLSGPETQMPLFLLGQESATTTSNMPLYLQTDGNNDGSLTITSGLPLYLQNSTSSANSAILLYIQTESGTPGAIPVNGSMPLYIARDYEGLASVVPLYMKVADVQNSGLSLYAMGTYMESSGIPLVIPNTVGFNTSGIPLFSHGF